jgi:hypothetical protein
VNLTENSDHDTCSHDSDKDNHDDDKDDHDDDKDDHDDNDDRDMNLNVDVESDLSEN